MDFDLLRITSMNRGAYLNKERQPNCLKTPVAVCVVVYGEIHKQKLMSFGDLNILLSIMKYVYLQSYSSEMNSEYIYRENVRE